MSLRRAISIAAMLLLLAAALPGPSLGAAAPTPETITLVRDGSDRHELVWTATGTFTDGCHPGGAIVPCWTTDRAVFGGGPFHFTVGQVLTTMNGADGSFGLRFEGLDRHDGSFAGSWEVIAGSGSGAYAGLRGHGSWSWAQDAITGNGVFTLLGAVRMG